MTDKDSGSTDQEAVSAAETRDEKYERQTKEQFAAIGRFTQAFEIMVLELRSCCSSAIAENYEQFELMNVIVNHRSLTAEPLSQIVRALFAVKIPKLPTLNDTQKTFATNVMHSVLADCSTLASKRNAILHGTWFIGYANKEQTDFNRMEGIKAKITKTGVEYEELPASAEELGLLIGEAERLSDVLRLIRMLRAMRDIDLTKLFHSKTSTEGGRQIVKWYAGGKPSDFKA